MPRHINTDMFCHFVAKTQRLFLNITILFQHVSTAVNVASVALPTPRIDQAFKAPNNISITEYKNIILLKIYFLN